MTIKKSLEVSGNFLFKYRGHIPLIVFVLIGPISFFTPYKTYAFYNGLNETILFTALFLIFIGQIYWSPFYYLYNYFHPCCCYYLASHGYF